MTTEHPDEALRAELRSYLGALAQAAAADTTDLFASGALKSIHLMELINHVEDRYGVRVTRKDVFAGHLRSVAGIAAFVADRTEAR